MYKVQKFFGGKSASALLSGTLLALSLAAPGNLAAEESITLTQTSSLDAVNVRIDQVTLVKLKNQIADILVGNPAIADITIQSRSSFVITGKSYGRTNIIILDKAGEAIFNRTIAVDDSSQNVVRLQKGTARVSYTCAPNCQPTPTLGDDRTHSKMLSDNYQDKLKEVGQAMMLTSQPN